MKTEDHQGFNSAVRMSTCEIDNLFQMVALLIKLEDTKCRNAVSPTKQLVIILQLLATGDSFGTWDFKVED
jgi:hypothetical protein